MRRAGFFAGWLFALCVGAMPAFADGLDITGFVTKPLHLTLHDLETMPATRLAVSFQGEHGREKATYTGALLWSLIGRAGNIADKGKRADLRHYLTITGKDGYSVILSLGELDPDFGAKGAIIAYLRDGKPIAADGAVRLVVPGDRQGGRNVRDVITIAVK